MNRQQTPTWHTLEIDKLFEMLTSSENGLSETEAKARLKQYGANQLTTKSRITFWGILARQIHSPIVYVLIASTALALIIREWMDALVVFCVVVLNTLIGFIQEYQAHRTIEELSAMLPHLTTVLRDGKRKKVPSSQLVPGDIVLVEAGDSLAADLRFIHTRHLSADESTLTGESVPCSKEPSTCSSNTPLSERQCMGFSGTHIASGTGVGIVVATGIKTEFGKISELIEKTKPLETPLSKTLKEIAHAITWGVLAASCLLFIIAYLKGHVFFDAGLAAIALAVAAIPEGLPAIITIASSIGIRRMSKKNVIIRQLPAVEALGSTNVICTDKTGTLTYNEMTVRQIWTPLGLAHVSEGAIESQSPSHQDEIHVLFRDAILCSDATHQVGDPTEIALIVAGKKAHLDEGLLRKQWDRIDSIPFESKHRMMSALHRSKEGETLLMIKGAPEEILSYCSVPSEKAAINHTITSMTSQGMRILAIAEKQSHQGDHIDMQQFGHDFRLLGFIGMIDPPRQGVYQAIETCQNAGIVVKMITGDHPLTAQKIGQELNLLQEGNVIAESDMQHFSLSEWQQSIQNNHIFARISPEHKLKLVEILQEGGNVVAMTGDGVNDAPALKRADIGIAMGIKGTAVAKEASDMVLVNDDFAGIEAAIEEGRRIYDNLVKSLSFVFPTSLAQALMVMIGIIFFPTSHSTLLQPISPIQILWVNLIVAVALALPLAFEEAEPNIMHRPPRKKDSKLFDRNFLISMGLVALVMALAATGVFLWKYLIDIRQDVPHVMALAHAQTLAVTTIILSQMLYLFHCRTLHRGAFQFAFSTNPMIYIGVFFVLIAQLCFIYIPWMQTVFQSGYLGWHEWGIALLGTSVLVLFIKMSVIFQRKKPGES
ncbi:MAG: HAD-IC family P-type ATPase [Simkaniaceae bacterium]|nr:HAD-IC family P-type ATPase [Simkaniaceae bacterium]